MTNFIENKLKEFRKARDENYKGQDPYWPNWEGIENFLIQALAEAQEDMIERIEEEIELHRHNSIPSFTADLGGGCTICIKNDILQSTLTILNNYKKI